MIKVMHVITALRRGGAEHNLKRLVANLDPSRFACTVAELRPGGGLHEDIKAIGTRVSSAGITSPVQLLPGLMRLRSLIAAEQPDIVQTWLYHADVLGSLAALPRRRSRLVWNIRNSDLEESRRRSWRVLTRMSTMLSPLVDCIVTNSRAGFEYHRQIGYRPRRWELIPNGWVAELSAPTPRRRVAARAQFGLPQDEFLIGFPARPARQKDHATFLSAARMATARTPNLRFVLFGGGLVQSAFPADPALIVLGELKNVAELLPALNCVTLTSSHGEGLPNAVGEAMAVGLPVVCTDVGDVKSLVGDGGIVVAAREPAAVADGWNRVLDLGDQARAELGERARRRIAGEYSLNTMIHRYEVFYESLMSGRP